MTTLGLAETTANIFGRGHIWRAMQFSASLLTCLCPAVWPEWQGRAGTVFGRHQNAIARVRALSQCLRPARNSAGPAPFAAQSEQ